MLSAAELESRIIKVLNEIPWGLAPRKSRLRRMAGVNHQQTAYRASIANRSLMVGRRLPAVAW